MKQRVLVFFFFFSILSVSAFPRLRQWPDGDYCIIMGNNGKCPEGFVESAVALTVPMDISPSDTEANGQKYIQTGKNGGVDLSARTYDSVYRLKISTCCRKT